VLSHADRGCVIFDEHRKKVFLSAARVTFLIDGFVRGALKVEESGDARYRTLRAPVQG